MIKPLILSLWLLIALPTREPDFEGHPMIETNYICPDCGEWGCIYEEIDESYEGKGTDSDIEQAIQIVCKRRGITDSTTIELLRKNYYL